MSVTLYSPIDLITNPPPCVGREEKITWSGLTMVTIPHSELIFRSNFYIVYNLHSTCDAYSSLSTGTSEVGDNCTLCIISWYIVTLNYQAPR